MKPTVENIRITLPGKQVAISNMAKLFSILTDLYKNPVVAAIREYISNAYDSVMEAGRGDINVNIEYERTEDNQFVVFTIRDSGIGMSKERFEGIFVNYTSSTKDLDNILVGGFGLGAKSALACSNIIEVTSVYNGEGRKWLYYKTVIEGRYTIPQYRLIDEWSENKDNYTQFKFKISYDTLSENGFNYERFVEVVLFYLMALPEEIWDIKFHEVGNNPERVINEVYYAGTGLKHTGKVYRIRLSSGRIVLVSGNIRSYPDYTDKYKNPDGTYRLDVLFEIEDPYLSDKMLGAILEVVPYAYKNNESVDHSLSGSFETVVSRPTVYIAPVFGIDELDVTPSRDNITSSSVGTIREVYEEFYRELINKLVDTTNVSGINPLNVPHNLGISVLDMLAKALALEVIPKMDKINIFKSIYDEPELYELVPDKSCRECYLIETNCNINPKNITIYSVKRGRIGELPVIRPEEEFPVSVYVRSSKTRRLTRMKSRVWFLRITYLLILEDKKVSSKEVIDYLSNNTNASGVAVVRVRSKWMKLRLRRFIPNDIGRVFYINRQKDVEKLLNIAHR